MLGFVACNDEEKEEVTLLKPDVYYRLCSNFNEENNGILIHELDRDSNIVHSSYIPSLGKSEKSSYRLAYPGVVCVSVYHQRIFHSVIAAPDTAYFHTVQYFMGGIQYNDLYLNGITEITEAEYREAFND